MVAQLQRGGRLPPTPTQDSPVGFRPGFGGRGNAAIQEMLRQRQPAPQGQMGVQSFEGIGESDDEVELGQGTLIPEAQQPGQDFLYGRATRDDASMKWEGGLWRQQDGTAGLVKANGQGGFWYDDAGHWNLGGQGHLGVCEGQHDFWGDQGEDDGYARVEGSLLSLDGGVRMGSDGGEFDASASALSLGVAAGTGWHEDSDTDWAGSAGFSLGSGGAGVGMWMSDVDGDGTSEFNFEGGLELLGGVGVSVSSEAVGSIYDDAREWFAGLLG